MLEQYLKLNQEENEFKLKSEIEKLSLSELKLLLKESKIYLSSAREEKKRLRTENEDKQKEIDQLKKTLDHLAEAFINCTSREDEIRIEQQVIELKGKKLKLEGELNSLYSHEDARCDETGVFSGSWPPSKLDIAAWLSYHCAKIIKERLA